MVTIRINACLRVYERDLKIKMFVLPWRAILDLEATQRREM